MMGALLRGGVLKNSSTQGSESPVSGLAVALCCRVQGCDFRVLLVEVLAILKGDAWGPIQRWGFQTEL